MDGPVLVISPHCDDAVFACGRLLQAHPGSTVVTVFAGRPPAGCPLTEWDQAAGFGPDDDVMRIRREEDRSALSLLRARPVWLDFCDSQYGCSPVLGDVELAIEKAVVDLEPCGVLAPLGLFHSDHAMTHEAVLGLMARLRTTTPWFFYEDTFYRRISGLLAERLAADAARGIRLTPVAFPSVAETDLKPQAVHCYRSQLRALATPGRPGWDDAFAPEAFWRANR